MNKKNVLKIGIVALCLAALLAVGLGIRFSLAYLSDLTDKMNSFTLGNVSVDIVETFDPDPIKTGENSYVKKVQVKNTGTVPTYARVSLEFSDVDTEEISVVSCDDGSSWYKLSELKDHLPDGWVYESDGGLGGYYYYTNPIAPEELTPALITNVKTTFVDKTEDTDGTNFVRDYDISVSPEGVPQMKLDGSGLYENYQEAWIEFLRLE